MRGSGLDFVRLCADNQRLSGKLSADELSRFSAALSAPEGMVEYDYEFSRGEGRRCFADGELSAEVQLVCQRCMKPMPFKLSASSEVQLVWSEEDEINAMSEREPLLVPETGLNLRQLVDEDAVLMLPLAPRCDTPETCGQYDAGPAVDETPLTPDEKPNPFAALAALKKSD